MTTPWSLWIGPGGRLADLAAVLGSLRGEPGARGAPAVAALGDLADLVPAPAAEPVRLVLDADALPLEDLGYVRRFLDGAPGRRLVLVGDDPTRRSARALLRREGARFLPWPLDLDELRRLLERPAAGAPEADGPAGAGARTAFAAAAPATFPPDPFAAAAPPRRDVPVATDAPRAAWEEDADPGRPLPGAARAAADELDEDELAVIRTILAAPPERAAGRDDGRGDDAGPPTALDDVAAWLDDEDDEDEDFRDELEAIAELDEERDHDARRLQREVTDVLAPKAPPPPRYFREQIADLADITQSIDLGLRASNAQAEPVARDVARLVQFTRTLGYLVAPPAQGHQRFDVGVLLEELVAQLVAQRRNAPRCLLRPDGELVVLSDKELLTQAFDALLFLAAACADEHDVVRIRAYGGDDDDEDTSAPGARIEIEFPAGPLAGVAPERIVEPYGIRDRIPDLGPNALRAAIGILAGQGGRAELVRLAAERLAWTVELPLADAPAGRGPSPGEDAL